MSETRKTQQPADSASPSVDKKPASTSKKTTSKHPNEQKVMDVDRSLGESVLLAMLISMILLGILYEISKLDDQHVDINQLSPETPVIWQYPEGELEKMVPLLIPRFTSDEFNTALAALPETPTEITERVTPEMINRAWHLVTALNVVRQGSETAMPTLYLSNPGDEPAYLAAAACGGSGTSPLVVINRDAETTLTDLTWTLTREWSGHLESPFACQTAPAPSISQLWMETYAQIAALHALTAFSTEPTAESPLRLQAEIASLRLYRQMLAAYALYTEQLDTHQTLITDEYPYTVTASAGMPVNHVAGRDLEPMLALLGPEQGSEYLEMIGDIREYYSQMFPGSVLG